MTDFSQQFCKEDIIIPFYRRYKLRPREGLGLNTNLKSETQGEDDFSPPADAEFPPPVFTRGQWFSKDGLRTPRVPPDLFRGSSKSELFP